MRHRGRTVHYAPEDRVIYNGVMEYLCRNWKEDITVAGLMISVGKYFLGVPYVSNTLEMKGEEILVINLREFDCFTFVENVVVMTWMIRKGECTFEDYAASLERIRYRDGILHEYPSRLHYFSDWLSDNEKKGIIKDMSGEMGGKALHKNIHYITSHRDTYPMMNITKLYEKMRAVERNLSEKPFSYIPKEDLKEYEMAIDEGDIIAITTDVEGLDIVHVGITARLDREIHLLHASEVEKKVVISDATLHEYLLNRKTTTGIMVGRLTEACRNDGNLRTI
jgi:hypothetical protein